jgi:hypothetical protein
MSSKRLMEGRMPDNLPSAVRVWPDGQSRLSDLLKSQGRLPPTSGGVLNPEWSEKLMGYLPGWTEIAP